MYAYTFAYYLLYIVVLVLVYIYYLFNTIYLSILSLYVFSRVIFQRCSSVFRRAKAHSVDLKDHIERFNRLADQVYDTILPY